MPPSTYTNVLQMIGNTPLMAVRRIDTGPCQLFLKLENQNPGGSIKDRVGLYLIEAAERSGWLKRGGTLIEATAGNTGLGLALVAAQKGYRLLLVIPDKMSQEKIFHLKAMGAEVMMTRSDVSKGHPEYYRDVAERLAGEIPDSYFVNQFGNPANALAHEETTAPEIWAQMGHDVDAVVCGAGTGGTLAGLTHFFARTAPQVQLVLADPLGSGLASYATTGRLPEKMTPWLVEGIGGDSVPPVGDFSRVYCSRRRASSPAPPPARCSRRRCATAARSSNPGASSASCATAATSTSPRSITTTGCWIRGSSNASTSGTCVTSSRGAIPSARRSP
jgi:cystathionine beta-synthase